MRFIRPWETDGVCSRVILKDFGEVQATTEVGNLSRGADALPHEEFVLQLNKMCLVWDEGECHIKGWSHWNAAAIPKLAVIEAYTAHTQPGVEESLQRLGFMQIGPFEKLKHPDTKLSVWIISAPAFCEAIGYKSEYDPRKD